jgi:hypothetical protein
VLQVLDNAPSLDIKISNTKMKAALSFGTKVSIIEEETPPPQPPFDSLTRKVKVSLPGRRTLHVVELQVFDTSGVNRARTATSSASQSSVYQWSTGGPLCQASIAIDGVIDGTGDCDGLAHTKEDYDPWLMVDLGGSYDIEKLRMYNRQNCCQNGLNNAQITLLNANGNIITEFFNIGDTSNLKVIDFATRMPVDSQDLIPLIQPSTYSLTRKVKVQVPGFRRLNIVEVQAFDKSGVNRAHSTASSASQSSVYTWDTKQCDASLGKTLVSVTLHDLLLKLSIYRHLLSISN